MAVKLRLMRFGKTKQPTYRVVAADSRSPRDGRFIEILGQYAPRAEPSVIKIDNAKAVKWLNTGAQPTERVAKLLEISGAMAEHKATKPSGGKPGAAVTKVAPAAAKPDAAATAVKPDAAATAIKPDAAPAAVKPDAAATAVKPDAAATAAPVAAADAVDDAAPAAAAESLDVVDAAAVVDAAEAE